MIIFSRMKLKDKTALITGASRGIGRAIALEFAREGASVIINYNKSEEADGLVKIIRQRGSEAMAIKADVSKLDEISSMFNKIKTEYRKLDVLVNNAGIYIRSNFLDSNEETWELTLNTNLKGAYFCSKFAAKTMLEQKSGDIINVSTNAGIFPRKSSGIEYGISKAGIIYLTKSLALTLAPYVRVNCIAPGYTETEMAVFYKNEELKRKIEKTIPLEIVN